MENILMSVICGVLIAFSFLGKFNSWTGKERFHYRN
jgi:hypothetical protein